MIHPEVSVSWDSAFGTPRRNLSGPTFCVMECSYQAAARGVAKKKPHCESRSEA